MAALIGNIGPFDEKSEKFSDYANHFKAYVAANDIDNNKKVNVFLEGQKGGCRARFTGIKIENSRFTGIKTDFSRIMHHSAFALLFHPYTPYSTMAAILVFFVFLQISPFCLVLKP